MNFSIGNIIIGTIGIIIGALMVKEAFRLNHHFFFLDFIERKYGGGTGTTAYRIIGLIVCMISIFIFFGIIELNARPRTNSNSNSVPSFINTDTQNRINIAP